LSDYCFTFEKTIAMSLQKRKIQLAQDVLRIEDEQTLTGMEQLLKQRRLEQFRTNLRPMTEDELNARIDQSEVDFKEGRFVPAEELLKKYRR
jgi:hypothetical protein